MFWLRAAIQCNFYPRPPRGGRRVTAEKAIALLDISIHALREEGDAARYGCCAASRNFYPRPPRGGRHLTSAFLTEAESISIHALREEGDFTMCGTR